MATFTVVSEGIWRWDGVDADHGFPIVGYVVKGEGGCVLIDPPGTSGTEEEIRAFGKPQAILITGRWHVRGAGKWKEAFAVPIAAPHTADEELAEAGTSADRHLEEGDVYLGWRVLELSAGEGAYSELALWQPERQLLVMGDLLVATEDGKLAFGPHLFSQVPVEELRPLAQRLLDLKPRLLLSGHLGDRENAQQLLAQFASA